MNKSGYIHRKFGKIAILKNDIEKVTPLANTPITIPFGSRGVFGYIGQTMDGKTCIVNNRNKLLLIKTKEKSYLINLDDRTSFIEKIKAG